MEARHLIDKVLAGATPAQVCEEEPSTFSKVSNFIFGRGAISKLAGGQAGTTSTTSTGGSGASNSPYAPSPGFGGKSLADLAQDSAKRAGVGPTSTIVHKSAGSTSSPSIQSPAAPAAVKPVSKPPISSKPLTQSEDDEFDLEEMEHGLTRSSRALARVKMEPTMFSKEGAKHGAKAIVTNLKSAVSPTYRKQKAVMGRFGLQPESRVSLLVRAVAEGADPRDVIRVAPRILESK